MQLVFSHPLSLTYSERLWVIVTVHSPHCNFPVCLRIATISEKWN